jgi:DegV family protein with EDD domain
MANKVALVTDSTTYIPPDISAPYEIHVTPSVVIWEGEELRDGVDISPEEFYSRLANATEMPTTSQPSPGAVFEKFEELHKKGFDILAFMVSEKLSGTLDSARRAKAMLPEATIEVVDGFSASMGTGFPLLEAAKAAREGLDLASCVKIVETARDNSGVLLLVDTLEFLHRGGRIGGASRFIGAALNLKPILEVQNGRVEPLERVRTKSKAIARMVEVAKERIGDRKPVHLSVIHANALDQAEKVAELLRQQIPSEGLIITDVSPAVGTHTGPGTLGVAYMAGYKR